MMAFEELGLRVPEPAAAEIARVREWLGAVDALAGTLEPDPPCLVVTPLGAPRRAWLAQALSACDVAVVARTPLPEWPAVSTALQVRRSDRDALRRAVLFERAWASLCPDGRAEAWTLAPGGHARVAVRKHALRSFMPRVRVHLGAASPRAAVLHPFHLADACDAEDEARRLGAALTLLGTGGACGAAGRRAIAPTEAATPAP